MVQTATISSHMQADLFAEIAPVVRRAARKMAKKYALRLQRGRVILAEDLENVGWVRILSQLERIEVRPTADERAKYVYTLVCNAIHNEMAHIFTSGDDAVRLTPQGTLDTGIGDSSYDGGAITFNTDDAAPIGVRPSPEWWSPPAIWAEWTRMVPRGRAKLLADSGLTLEHVNTGWNAFRGKTKSK
jgi:hypothetical protein